MTPRVIFCGRLPTSMLKSGISVKTDAIFIAKHIDVRGANVACTFIILVFLVKPTFVPVAAFVKVGSLWTLAASYNKVRSVDFSDLRCKSVNVRFGNSSTNGGFGEGYE